MIANVYNAGQAAEIGHTLSTEEIVTELQQQGRQAICIAGVDEIVHHLAPQLQGRR
ncbi:MAG: hypothetical protein WKF30_18415 [Pyrinomonadaceae bacterium]